MKFFFHLSLLLVHGRPTATSSNCQPYCKEPCHELNGDVANECGGCDTSYSCHPGHQSWPQSQFAVPVRQTSHEHALSSMSAVAPATPQNNLVPPVVSKQLRPAVAKTSPFLSIDIKKAASRSHKEHCRLLASRGFCATPYRADMDKFCRHACDRIVQDSFPDEHEEWSKLSLFDFTAYDTSRCVSHGSRQQLLHSRHPCKDVDDLSLIETRGWAVRRGLVPSHELDTMMRHVQQIREPARSMCGAGGFQPGECFLSSNRLQERYPHFHRALTEMLEGWIASGFHERASLGWPLRPSGGMFINIHRWKHDRSATCIFRALFRATHAIADQKRKRCIAKHACDSATRHGIGEVIADRAHACLECWWRSLRSLPRETVRSVMVQPVCAPLPDALAFVQAFGFAMSAENAPDIVTEMHGWLTIMLNDTSTWQGFHPWHQDGPPKAGRSHKAFVLISKNSTIARTNLATDPASRRTNLLTASAAYRYAFNCEVDSVGDFVWNDPAALCAPRLLPGDVLFFREDVFHRTQDALLDRLALIVDVLRVPLRTTPLKQATPGTADHASMRDTSSGSFVEVMDALRQNTGVPLGCDIAQGAVHCRK